MKTNEFIRQAQELSFEVFTPQNGSLYVSYLDIPIARVELYRENAIHFETGFYGMLEDETRKVLLSLLYTYTKTPIEDREEEKEYYIKHKYFSDENGYLNYINDEYEDEEDKWFLGDSDSSIAKFKSIFTLEELPDWVHKMLEDGYMIKEEA